MLNNNATAIILQLLNVFHLRKLYLSPCKTIFRSLLLKYRIGFSLLPKTHGSQCTVPWQTEAVKKGFCFLPNQDAYSCYPPLPLLFIYRINEMSSLIQMTTNCSPAQEINFLLGKKSPYYHLHTEDKQIKGKGCPFQPELVTRNRNWSWTTLSGKLNG